MKKIFFVGILLFPVVLYAQSTWRFGLETGTDVAFSHIMLNTTQSRIRANNRPGVWGGGVLEFSPGDSGSIFKLQTELLYSDMNVNFPMDKSGTGLKSNKINLQQFNIPFTGKLFIMPSLSLNAGLSLNFNVTGKTTLITQYNITNFWAHLNSNRLKVIQPSFTLGGTYYFKKLFIDLKYNSLFSGINKYENGTNSFPDMDGKIKWGTMYLGIGIWL